MKPGSAFRVTWRLWVAIAAQVAWFVAIPKVFMAIFHATGDRGGTWPGVAGVAVLLIGLGFGLGVVAMLDQPQPRR
jgi:hypothetical protein